MLARRGDVLASRLASPRLLLSRTGCGLEFTGARAPSVRGASHSLTPAYRFRCSPLSLCYPRFRLSCLPFASPLFLCYAFVSACRLFCTVMPSQAPLHILTSPYPHLSDSPRHHCAFLPWRPRFAVFPLLGSPAFSWRLRLAALPIRSFDSVIALVRRLPRSPSARRRLRSFPALLVSSPLLLVSTLARSPWWSSPTVPAVVPAVSGRLLLLGPLMLSSLLGRLAVLSSDPRPLSTWSGSEGLGRLRVGAFFGRLGPTCPAPRPACLAPLVLLRFCLVVFCLLACFCLVGFCPVVSDVVGFFPLVAVAWSRFSLLVPFGSQFRG